MCVYKKVISCFPKSFHDAFFSISFLLEFHQFLMEQMAPFSLQKGDSAQQAVSIHSGPISWHASCAVTQAPCSEGG